MAQSMMQLINTIGRSMGHTAIRRMHAAVQEVGLRSGTMLRDDGQRYRTLCCVGERVVR